MSLDDTFNIEPTKITGDIIAHDGSLIVPHDSSTERNVDADYEKTRTNLHNLLTQGQEALMHALDVAKSSEHPRAFEVVGGLMKQLADINHQLLDLSEKRQKIVDKVKDSNSQQPNNPQVTNNNAFFVGSTAELNKMLQNLNKG